MTLDAALWAGYFARVVWAIPQKEGATQIEAKALGRQLQDAGFATADEVASLRQVGSLVEGRLRNTPLTVGSLSALQALGEPVVVHIDPSYYEKLYLNEIKTPLLPLVKNSLKQLKALQISTLGVTYADANLDQRFALDGRYLGDFLVMMFAEPQQLAAELPEVWKGEAEILYLQNFMQKDKIEQIARQMVVASPQSAWVKFSLYRAAQESNIGEVALQALADAVQLNSVYALEYENLAEQAYDRGRPDAALRMLKLAQANFPDNPHLWLKIAQLSNELGDQKTALELARSLQSLDWSEVYYPQMPQFLEGFVKHLEQGEQ
jgi:tetratricopeptide (TPR) repeat protein